MAVKPVDKIWMNGKLVDWNDAKIHVLSHVIHYGSSWFEGIRCYETKKGSAHSYYLIVLYLVRTKKQSKQTN